MISEKEFVSLASRIAKALAYEVTGMSCAGDASSLVGAIAGMTCALIKDDVWSVMLEEASMPCGKDGCPCHIENGALFQALDEMRDSAVAANRGALQQIGFHERKPK